MFQGVGGYPADACAVALAKAYPFGKPLMKRGKEFPQIPSEARR